MEDKDSQPDPTVFADTLQQFFNAQCTRQEIAIFLPILSVLKLPAVVLLEE